MKSSSVFPFWMAVEILVALSHGFTTTTTSTHHHHDHQSRLQMSTKQAEYGKETPMPDTYAQCGRCQSAFALTEEDLGPNGRGRYENLVLFAHEFFAIPMFFNF